MTFQAVILDIRWDAGSQYDAQAGLAREALADAGYDILERVLSANWKGWQGYRAVLAWNIARQGKSISES